MAVHPVYIEAEEEIPEVVERLRSHDESDVPIVVPPRSRLAQSRFNFQLLREYAGRLGKKVAIISPDPAVQAMAAEHGFQAYPGLDQYAPGTFVPASTAAAGAAAAVAVPGYAPAPAQAAYAPPASYAPPEPYAPAPYPAPAPPFGSRTRPPQAGPRSARDPRDLDLVEDEVVWTGPNRALLYAGAATVLLVGLIALILFVPSATVTLTAQAKAFSQTEDITAAPGVSGPVHVRLLDSSQQSSQQFKATGTKITPAQPATGQVVYTNNCNDPFSSGLRVPDGQRLDGPNGQVFAQQGQVDVNNGSTATATVIGVKPGAASNVPPNTITTIEADAGVPPPSCLTVTNPNPTGGGADQRTDPLLTQQDLDGAKQSLTDGLKQKIVQDLQKQLGSGEKLDPNVNYAAATFQADHHAGELVPGFTASAALKGTGSLYSDVDVKAQLQKYLRDHVPAGFVPTDNKVHLDYSISQSQAGGHLVFHGTAAAFIAPRLDFDQIKSSLAAHPAGSADGYLKTLPVASHRIDEHPFSLPLLPLLTSRINVEYVVEQGPQTGA